VRGSEPPDSLSLTVAQRLSRFFDLVTALAGMAALIILGPGMLIDAATVPVPEAGELIQLDGITVTCRPTVGGAELRLAGYAREFHSLLDSCEKALVQPGRTAHVSLHVVRSDLNARQRAAPIPSFGLIVEGKVVNMLSADLSVARVDRMVLSACGLLASAVLVWLGWLVVSRRGAFLALLTDAADARRV
jgi:hypothetical protein